MREPLQLLKNHRIQLDNLENHENLRIPIENQNNHVFF